MIRVTFCKGFLKRQQQLEKDNQPHLWDISKTKLPKTFTTYTAAGKKDKTLPFHISAFGQKIGAKWFHEFMHTELFNPDLDKFSDKKVSGGAGGLAYGFDGAVGLAKQKEGKNIAESSRNIENILYWSLAMYYDKWVWSTGNPEDPTSLTTSPVKAASVDEEFQVEAAAKKGGSKKTTKPDDPPKTEPPASPPKTSAAAAPPAPSSQAAPPPATSAAVPPPPASSQVPPAQTNAPLSTQLPPASAPASAPAGTKSASRLSTPLSGTSSMTSSIHASCSNTLCTRPSSSTSPTSSDIIPQETFESEPITAGSMAADEIIAVAGAIAVEQVAAMALWDQAFVAMGLPNKTVEADPSASMGTGLPMATGGAGGTMNGTWTMPTLKARDGVQVRRMYDYAS